MEDQKLWWIGDNIDIFLILSAIHAERMREESCYLPWSLCTLFYLKCISPNEINILCEATICIRRSLLTSNFYPDFSLVEFGLKLWFLFLVLRSRRWILLGFCSGKMGESDEKKKISENMMELVDLITNLDDVVKYLRERDVLTEEEEREVVRNWVIYRNLFREHLLIWKYKYWNDVNISDFVCENEINL